ncbi:hypothetical protein [Rhizobium sp. Rhizsp82]|uniref:hypothetical protein n=1 Tax=Rhizobium sp. Rhizsp82 TaxID=3243057 RepID=UPI0039B640A0
MYSPDFADRDPRNPANHAPHTFKVCSYQTKGSRVWIDDVLDEIFTTEADAKAALLAITAFKGEELDVLEFDEDGDEMCVFCAEWDEDQKRYIEA